jgi:GrxC family glutaredoxin
MDHITVYATAACPFCMRAKELLEKKGAAFTTLRVDTNPEYIDEMVQKSGGRTTVPQIFIDGYHVGGFDELKALDDKGGLDPLLG